MMKRVSYAALLILATAVCLTESSMGQSDENPAQPAGDSNPALPAGSAVAEDTIATPFAPLAADAVPIPNGYTLQFYDDCGTVGRQPHLKGESAHTFPEGAVDAPLQCRTVAYSSSGKVVARYENLDGTAQYVVAVTYATEKESVRRQSLHAGSHELHGPRDLPDGRAERCTFRIPAAAIQDGKLELTFKLVAGPNPVVSEIELWAPLPSPGVIRLEPWPGQDGVLVGRITNIRFDPVIGADVTVSRNAAGDPIAKSKSDAAGVFRVEGFGSLGLTPPDILQAVVHRAEHRKTFSLRADEFLFFPPVYRPVAAAIPGLSECGRLLDGMWRINPNPPTGFEQNAASDQDSWRDFEVPGQLVQQGLQVSSESEFALVHEFDLPADWDGRRTFIRFEGGHGEFEYFLNGVHLGRSEVLYTPVEFEITSAVQLGKKNRLALRLRTDGRTVPARLASSVQYAHHNPAGIHRSVRVFALPTTHISRAWIDPRLDDSLNNGDLRLDLTIDHSGEKRPGPSEIQIKLADASGDVVAVERDTFPLGDLNPGENRRDVRCAVERPRLWSAETPNLYTLELTLLAEDRPLETIRRNIGFRRIKVKGNWLLVNGKPVKLFGVNRHEIDPLTGRANTARHAATDARLFKEANCNYIRTSHYPPTREFLNACDRIGLYVECEAPFCWTHKEPEEDNPQFRRQFLEPTAAMLEYHHAHPSVAFWSLGNESGWKKPHIGIPSNYRATNAYAKRVNPSRLTAFNNSWGNDDNQCDIAVIHYPPVGDFSQMLTFPDDPRPVLIGEYLHVMCYNVDELRVDPGGIIEEWAQNGIHRFGSNNNRSFWDADSIWNRIYTTDRYLGLAIWGGIDEVFHFPDGSTNGYGPWGLIDGWRRKKPEWWHTKMMYSPVWIPARQVDYDPATGRACIAIENRYGFTDLSSLNIRWQAAEAEGTIQGPKVPPGSKGVLEIDLSPGLPSGEILVLEFLSEQGTLVSAWGLDLGEPASHSPPSPNAGAPKWERNGDLLRIDGDGFALNLNTSTGEFLAGDNGDASPLRTFPTIHVTQAEHKMVFVPKGAPYLELPDASTRVIESLDAAAGDDALAVTMKERYEHFAGTTTWLIDRQGVGVVSFDYVYTGPPRELREVGVRMMLDLSCQSLSWKRRGLWGVYPDDHTGRLTGEAKAQRNGKLPATDASPRPAWPWRLDASDLGTNDFRSTKFSVYEAALVNSTGAGLSVASNAEANVRSCVTPHGVMLHILESGLPRSIKAKARLTGRFHIQLAR